jgi:hypothetical protein
MDLVDGRLGQRGSAEAPATPNGVGGHFGWDSSHDPQPSGTPSAQGGYFGLPPGADFERLQRKYSELREALELSHRVAADAEQQVRRAFALKRARA